MIRGTWLACVLLFGCGGGAGPSGPASLSVVPPSYYSYVPQIWRPRPSSGAAISRPVPEAERPAAPTLTDAERAEILRRLGDIEDDLRALRDRAPR